MTKGQPGERVVRHGSPEHAALLGLVKDKEGNWQLADPTAFGPAATEQYLARVLQQKINELTTRPKPTDIPMWVPRPGAPVATPDDGIAE